MKLKPATLDATVALLAISASISAREDERERFNWGSRRIYSRHEKPNVSSNDRMIE